MFSLRCQYLVNAEGGRPPGLLGRLATELAALAVHHKNAPSRVHVPRPKPAHLLDVLPHYHQVGLQVPCCPLAAAFSGFEAAETTALQ